jgi:hypothetical protein
MIFYLIKLEPCIPINLINQNLIASASSPHSLSGDLSRQISAGSSGVSSFLTTQPEVTFIYPNQFVQTLYDVNVPIEKSNVRQIQTTYIASPDGSTLLTDSKGNVISHQSPMNNPKITLNSPQERIYGFTVKILATSDNSIPRNVTMTATGCQKSSKKLFLSSQTNLYLNLGATTTLTTPSPYYNIPRACLSSSNLLATPTTYIRSIVANSKPVDINQFQNKTAIGYTFPTKADEYLIDVNFLLPITVDRMGIFAGQNGTNVDSFDVILNQSPEYPEKSGRIGELVLSDANNKGASDGVTFRIQKTTDGSPPKNFIIYIEGCNQHALHTKAQVEPMSTTESSLFRANKVFLILFLNFFF